MSVAYAISLLPVLVLIVIYPVTDVEQLLAIGVY